MKLCRTATCGVCLVAAFAGAAPASDDYAVPREKRDHWAWKSPNRPAVPAVRAVDWVQNPIDAFILSKLEAAGLSPAREATREQLIRRATYDLTGLPPTPEEIDAFLADRAPGAWERVIDRLLASPHYGERWGRHWLDLARFAESNGYEHDEIRPTAWRYRDYVIRAFNADKPFDRFIREQVAGDELFPDEPDALIATGFHLLGPDMTDAASQVQRRLNTLNDMTDTTSLVFLGMTAGCARCHDHKFEPIPQRDYFRLQAFFAPATFRQDLTVATKEQRAAFDRAQGAYLDRARPTLDELAKLEGPHRTKLREARLAKLSPEAQKAHRTPESERDGGQKELVEQTNRFVVVTAKQLLAAMPEAEQKRHGELTAHLKTLDRFKPKQLPSAPGLHEKGPPPKTHVLKRGEIDQPGEEVRPGFPLILSAGLKPADAEVRQAPSSSGRRAALAEWLTRPDHPLTARVLVNRLWQQHFGRGIVATASDFGVRGATPSHPELLDWLASEFVRGGWSLKRMHRLMLTSAAYRQSTAVSSDARKKDPDNRLLGRMNRLRLEGEAVRDALLMLSGKLDRRVGGPSVFPPLPAEVRDKTKPWPVSADVRDHARRSVYIFARRNLRFAFLEPFDLPDSNLSCPKRERSTTATQSLVLLNAPEVTQAASALAARLQREAPTADGRITLAYRLTLGRQPTAAEAELSREFLRDGPLSELCRALVNVNEFVYLD